MGGPIVQGPEVTLRIATNVLISKWMYALFLPRADSEGLVRRSNLVLGADSGRKIARI